MNTPFWRLTTLEAEGDLGGQAEGALKLTLKFKRWRAAIGGHHEMTIVPARQEALSAAWHTPGRARERQQPGLELPARPARARWLKRHG